MGVVMSWLLENSFWVGAYLFIGLTLFFSLLFSIKKPPPDDIGTVGFLFLLFGLLFLMLLFWLPISLAALAVNNQETEDNNPDPEEQTSDDE